MNEEIIRLNRALMYAEAWGFYHTAKAIRITLDKFWREANPHFIISPAEVVLDAGKETP